MPDLSDEELDALVEEATVDAYGDDEQLGGFAVMIEDNLELPFDTTVLGVVVTVQKVTQAESGIVADCVRDGHHQAISVLDLPLPEPRPLPVVFLPWRCSPDGGRAMPRPGCLSRQFSSWPGGQ
jgi:hypothetical protein